MSVSVQDIFDFATRLSVADTEIDWRDSVGRAYYAAYHRAKVTVELCPSNAHLRMGDHERIHERFDLHEAKSAKAISASLQILKRYRRMADYEIEDPFEKSLAAMQIENCKKLFDRLVAFENLNKVEPSGSS
jgi:uncharacterized protein (UPF0332 family)